MKRFWIVVLAVAIGSLGNTAKAQGLPFFPGGTPGPDFLDPGAPPAGAGGWEVWDSGGFLPADGQHDDIETAGNGGQDLIRAGIEDTIHGDPDDVVVIFVPGFYLFPVYAGRLDTYLELRGYLLRGWWKLRRWMQQGFSLRAALGLELEENDARIRELEDRGEEKVVVGDLLGDETFVLPEDWAPLEDWFVDALDAGPMAGKTVPLADEVRSAAEVRARLQEVSATLSALLQVLGEEGDGDAGK